MDPAVAAILQSWTFPPWLIIALLIAAGVYLRGWRRLHRRLSRRFAVWRLIAFQAGLLVLFLALASPLDVLADLLLQVHMIQHLVLMMVVPPLLWLGAPLLPLLCGLPQLVVKRGLGPFLVWPALQRLGHLLTHPLVCWCVFVVTNVTWHVPPLYEVALRSQSWHEVQHACFLGTALLFWWPVIQPWPSRPRWPRWVMIPYLLLADLQNTALSAFLMFSERILYPTYATVPRLWDISVRADQAAAGAIMWVPGSVIFLVPMGVLIIRLLDAPRTRRTAFFATALLLAGVWPAWGHHGGEVRLMEKAGPFFITVFTDPTPLWAGPVDLSVMVQDGDRGRPLLDAEVTMRLQEQGTGRPPLITQATREHSTNKLLYSALVDLPTPGLWKLRVDVQQGTASAQVDCEITAAPPRPWLLSGWPYATLLPVALGIIILHHWLSRRCVEYDREP